MTQRPKISFLVVAGGRGMRAGPGLPKQYRPLAGKSVLVRSIEALRSYDRTAPLWLVAGEERMALAELSTVDFNLAGVVSGGASRQASVRNGLEAMITEPPDIVLIHDAARPFIDTETIGKVIAAFDDSAIDGCAPGLPLIDSIKRRFDQGDQIESVSRDGLWRVQTPQAFRFEHILDAHRRCIDESAASDDLEISALAGGRLTLVAGKDSNFKITTVDDMERAENMILNRLNDVRVGNGFDVHAFCDGDHVMLCGIRVPHTRGLAGHSDADAGLHALTDALLGAIGAGDIGAHFPPSDQRWRGAASDQFLKHAADLVRQADGEIAHVDITAICEAPKVGPHRAAMISRIAEILGISISRVSVKATTTEQLGFTGRREGLAAMATATVRLPS